jgi:hypothetical protein
MNNAYDGWLRQSAVDHYVSFADVRSQAEHRELKIWKLSRQLKQIR